ncbi:hypothetical protein [Streptomyces sp. NBC_00316]|uniref:hypothetical protein n=1 Tax=Streptomyces sp. NBC_00316 TaxID=2975710 RepID=UPI002E2CC23F|nr:hypothetical protein [Streptomyces sp. NBC_00316]
MLGRAETSPADTETVAPTLTMVRALAQTAAPQVIVAVGGHDEADAIVDAAARLARDTGSLLRLGQPPPDSESGLRVR